MNNVDRQDKPPNSKRGLSENVYAMFGGNAMSHKVTSCLLCSIMPIFCFRLRNAAPVPDSRPMSRLRLSLDRAPLQDEVVHGEVVGGAGGGGNDDLGTPIGGLAFVKTRMRSC